MSSLPQPADTIHHGGVIEPMEPQQESQMTDDDIPSELMPFWLSDIDFKQNKHGDFFADKNQRNQEAIQLINQATIRENKLGPGQNLSLQDAMVLDSNPFGDQPQTTWRLRINDNGNVKWWDPREYDNLVPDEKSMWENEREQTISQKQGDTGMKNTLVAAGSFASGKPGVGTAASLNVALPSKFRGGADMTKVLETGGKAASLGSKVFKGIRGLF